MQIAALGGDVGDLPVALLNGSWMNTDQVANWAVSHKIVYLVDSHDAEKCSGNTLKENVLIEAAGFKPLLDISLWDPRWHTERRRNEPSKNWHPVVRAVAKAWSVDVRDVEVWSGENVITNSRYGDDFPVDVQTLKLESVEFE